MARRKGRAKPIWLLGSPLVQAVLLSLLQRGLDLGQKTLCPAPTRSFSYFACKSVVLFIALNIAWRHPRIRERAGIVVAQPTATQRQELQARGEWRVGHGGYEIDGAKSMKVESSHVPERSVCQDGLQPARGGRIESPLNRPREGEDVDGQCVEVSKPRGREPPHRVWPLRRRSLHT